MLAFKIFWAIDAIASLIICYFFFIGLSDGTVSSRNMGLWMGIIAVIAGVMLGSIWLRNHQHHNMAFGLVLLLALPVLCYILYFLVAILGGGRWN